MIYINNIHFLEEVETEDWSVPEQGKLFTKLIRVYKSKSNEKLKFKISTDWDGNWLTGTWTFQGEQIHNEEQLFELLTEDEKKELLYNINLFNEISQWGAKPKYVSENAKLGYE